MLELIGVYYCRWRTEARAWLSWSLSSPLHQSSFSLLALLELFLEFNKRPDCNILNNCRICNGYVFFTSTPLHFTVKMRFYFKEATLTQKLDSLNARGWHRGPQLTTEEDEARYVVTSKAFSVWNKAGLTCCQWTWHWRCTDANRDRLKSLTP